MTEYRFVSELPDLIQPEEYAADPEGQRVKLRIRVTAEGVEILGDATNPLNLEGLLLEVEPETIEQMLCG